jgi:hypothetical protein
VKLHTAALSVALLVSGCTIVDVKKFPDPHGHTIPPHKLPTSRYHEDDMMRVDPHDLKLFKPADMESAENPGRTKEAAVVGTRHQRFGYPVPVLVVYRDDKKTLAYMSKTWPNRPLGNLVWMNDQLLAFDLYGGVDLGWHYILDASTGSMIFAAPFADAAPDQDTAPDAKESPAPADKPEAPAPPPAAR